MCWLAISSESCRRRRGRGWARVRGGATRNPSHRRSGFDRDRRRTNRAALRRARQGDRAPFESRSLGLRPFRSSLHLERATPRRMARGSSSRVSGNCAAGSARQPLLSRVKCRGSGLGTRGSGLGLPAVAHRAKAETRSSGTQKAHCGWGADGAMYIAVGSPTVTRGRSCDFSPTDASRLRIPAGPALLVHRFDAGRYRLAAGRRFLVDDRNQPHGRSVRGAAPWRGRRLCDRSAATRHCERLASRAARHAGLGLAIVNAPASPFDGDAIVSSLGLADLLRFDGSRADPPAGDPVRLLQGRFGAIGGVTTTSSGDIYFFTRNNETWGAGRDVLVRLRVE